MRTASATSAQPTPVAHPATSPVVVREVDRQSLVERVAQAAHLVATAAERRVESAGERQVESVAERRVESGEELQVESVAERRVESAEELQVESAGERRVEPVAAASVRSATMASTTTPTSGSTVRIRVAR